MRLMIGGVRPTYRSTFYVRSIFQSSVSWVLLVPGYYYVLRYDSFAYQSTIMCKKYYLVQSLSIILCVGYGSVREYSISISPYFYFERALESAFLL